MTVKQNNQRMKSLDSKLPMLGGDGDRESGNGFIPLSNKNIKLPILASQNYPSGLAVYDSQNKLKQNIKYRLQSGNRYKNLKNEYSIIHKNHYSKDNKNSKAPKKVKLISQDKQENSSKTVDKSKFKSNRFKACLYFKYFMYKTNQ